MLSALVTDNENCKSSLSQLHGSVCSQSTSTPGTPTVVLVSGSRSGVPTGVRGVVLISAGSVITGDVTTGVVTAGVVTTGVVTAGVVTTGVVTAGVVTTGVVTAGVVTTGVVTAGVVTTGVVTAGVVTTGVVTAGVVTMGLVAVGIVTAGVDTTGVVTMGLVTTGITTTGVCASGNDVPGVATPVVVSGSVVPVSVTVFASVPGTGSTGTRGTPFTDGSTTVDSGVNGSAWTVTSLVIVSVHALRARQPVAIRYLVRIEIDMKVPC